MRTAKLLRFQKAFRSESSGKVSIRMAIVCPLPVTGRPLALYALRISLTRYGGAFWMLGEGPMSAALVPPFFAALAAFLAPPFCAPAFLAEAAVVRKDARLPCNGTHMRLCL